MDIKDYILDHATGNLYWKNLSGEYLGCNVSFANIAKVRPSNIVGKTDRQLFLDSLGEEGITALENTDQYVMQNNAVVIKEELGINEEGEKAFYQTRKIPLKNEKQEIIGLMGTSIDITKQKISEQAKNQFIRNMEHDIRTPLAGLLGVTQLLSEQEKDPEKKLLLATAATGAKELLNYCNEILNFSRTQFDPMPVTSKNFNLLEIIQQVYAIEYIAAKEKNVSLNFICDEHQLPNLLKGDAYRLKRILLNLLGNAIKFTEVGFVELSISSEKLDQSHIKLKIQVKDTGIGMSKESKNSIYEQFTRLHPSNQGIYKGLGLGLAHTKQFVEDLQGTLEFTSDAGKGTTFIVVLPMAIGT